MKNNVVLQKAKFCHNFVNALFNSLQSYFWDIFTYFSFTLKPWWVLHIEHCTSVIKIRSNNDILKRNFIKYQKTSYLEKSFLFLQVTRVKHFLLIPLKQLLTRKLRMTSRLGFGLASARLKKAFYCSKGCRLLMTSVKIRGKGIV